MNGSESHLIAIVEQIADQEGVPASQIQPPLYETIDTEALESLLSDIDGSSVEVQFEYSGYRIHASSDGTHEITERPEATA